MSKTIREAAQALIDAYDNGCAMNSDIEALRDAMKPAAALPLYDAATPDTQRGLYAKFNVSRNDGSDLKGGKHHGCEHFVLDVTHDKHASTALLAYAASVSTTNPQLAADMRARWGLK